MHRTWLGFVLKFHGTLWCTSSQFIRSQPALRDDVPIYNLDEATDRKAQVAERNTMVIEVIKEEYDAYKRELEQRAEDRDKILDESQTASEEENKILNWEVLSRREENGIRAEDSIAYANDQ